MAAALRRYAVDICSGREGAPPDAPARRVHGCSRQSDAQELAVELGDRLEEQAEAAAPQDAGPVPVGRPQQVGAPAGEHEQAGRRGGQHAGQAPAAVGEAKASITATVTPVPSLPLRIAEETP